MKTKHIIVTVGLLTSMVGLTACNDSDNTIASVTPDKVYSVTVTNLTQNQPLSPPALILHGAAYNAWKTGQAASVALEKMAEGGDNTALLADATANSSTLMAKSGSAAIGPGATATLTASVTQNTNLSLASMLVNTNDAFTGIDTLSLAAMNVGDSVTHDVPAYDAGTELNDELAANIPGPAAGGEGFNAARSDTIDKVLAHAGVVSMDDGLATSGLDQSHRFDNPVARIIIKRTQ